MPFKKGQSGNPTGRPADPNIKIIREAQRQLLKDGLTKLRDYLFSLDGKDYAELYLKIQREVMPALATEIEQGEMERTVMSIYEMVTAKKDEYESKKLKAVHKESQVV